MQDGNSKVSEELPLFVMADNDLDQETIYRRNLKDVVIEVGWSRISSSFMVGG